uniref:Putative secreted protein n=1 Tax=Anopheles darlingi TaxID=43151 RepID=A0A2M4D888_ANODA
MMLSGPLSLLLVLEPAVTVSEAVGEADPLVVVRRAICVCCTPSRSVRCNTSKAGVVWAVANSESVEMRSGSLSKPSSSERVGLRIGFERISGFPVSIVMPSQEL